MLPNDFQPRTPFEWLKYLSFIAMVAITVVFTDVFHIDLDPHKENQ